MYIYILFQIKFLASNVKVQSAPLREQTKYLTMLQLTIYKTHLLKAVKYLVHSVRITFQLLSGLTIK